MKRFFNFRPLVWIFLTIVGAVYSVIKIFIGNYVPMIIFGTFIFAILTLLVLNFVKTDIFKAFFARFGIKSVKFFCIMILCSAILSSSISVLSFSLLSKRPFENGTYTISAKVKEIDNSSGEISLLLGNVAINDSKQSFKIFASTENTTLNVGDEISFEGYLSKRDLVKNGKIQTNLLKTNTFYYCSIDDETLLVSPASAMLTDAIKSKTKMFLQENMTQDNAGFAYALLVGDKSLLSETYYNSFKNAGLAHVLAVSGLHVGFLIAIVEIILKLCKVKGKYRFIIISALLLLYNILCNFAPSVFRASVMSVCLLLGLILGERNDILSNLSLAGIIILMIMPLYLFDVGFLLSFSSVFGILFFAKPISKLLRKIKFPEILANSIAVTVGATIGTIPFVFRYFGEFAPISIISNLLVLPLFSIMFAILVLCSFLNLIANLPFLISFSQFFVNIVTNFSAILAKFGVISTLSFNEISIVLYYIICIIASPYFMVSAKSKLLSALGFVVCIAGTISLYSVQKIIKPNNFYANKNAITSTLYTTESNRTILTNIDDNSYKFYATKNMLTELKIKQVDYLILFNYSDIAQTNVAEIANSYNIQNVFVFGEFDNSTKAGLISALYKTSNLQFVNGLTFEIENFSLEIYNSSGITKALDIKLGDTKILQILKSISSAEILDNQHLFCNKTYDICIVEKMFDRYFEINASKFVAKNASITSSSQKIEILVDANLWTYSTKYATIIS